MILERRKDIDVEAFYVRYGPMVVRRCRRLLGDEQAAYDATQEVFLKVLARRERLTGDYPSALLFRIATNTCLNRLREDRKHGLREPAAHGPPLPDQDRPLHAGRRSGPADDRRLLHH